MHDLIYIALNTPSVLIVLGVIAGAFELTPNLALRTDERFSWVGWEWAVLAGLYGVSILWLFGCLASASYKSIRQLGRRWKVRPLNPQASE